MTEIDFKMVYPVLSSYLVRLVSVPESGVINCRQSNIGPERSIQKWIIADLANRSNILVHSKQYNQKRL